MVDVGTGSATLQQLASDLLDAVCANMVVSGRFAVAPEAASEGCKQRQAQKRAYDLEHNDPPRGPRARVIIIIRVGRSRSVGRWREERVSEPISF